MRTFIVISLLLVIAYSAYYLTSYRSAFEADQACHSEQWHAFGEKAGFGCDHDLETNQWILYEEIPNHMPAKVLRRFRY